MQDSNTFNVGRRAEAEIAEVLSTQGSDMTNLWPAKAIIQWLAIFSSINQGPRTSTHFSTIAICPNERPSVWSSAVLFQECLLEFLKRHDQVTSYRHIILTGT